MIYVIQFKRGDKAVWEKKNLLLEAGEPGFELDTGRFKIGNGILRWNDLPYAGGEASLSPDGKSLAINQNGALSVYGYEQAQANQVPMKTDNGIKWIDLAMVAQTGNINDLQQSSTITLYGGSATDLI